MPKTTLAGHPLHPQLISAPAGLLPASLVFDLMYLSTGKESYAQAAYYTLVGGTAGGLAAGLAGAGDWASIPQDTPLKRVATLHGALNVSALALSGINILLRRGKRTPTGAVPIAISTVVNGGLLVSAWLGGQMVYEDGMRVRGVSPVANAPELKLPGDTALTGMFQSVADRVE